MNSKFLLKFLILMMPFFSAFGQQGQEFEALYTATPPTIDGSSDDTIWNNIDTWYTYHQVWLDFVGTPPSPEDFSWRFKLAWDENYFYILAEIKDDVLNDHHPNPLQNYWEDDTWEIFFDEDNSGGNHQNSFQAFAYHISLTYDIVDLDNNGNSVLLNDHADIRMDTIAPGTYLWEGAFKIYDQHYTVNGNHTPVTLFPGKVMGWGMAYCDNDGGPTREHFLGAMEIDGENKNIAWQTADVFGEVTLVDPSTPIFSHVRVASGLTNPTAMTIASNGDIYVTQQNGRLRVVKDGQLQSENLTTLSVNLDGPGGYTERGLLGVALDPHFDHNNYIYLFYTTNQGGVHNRVSRFTIDGTNNIDASEVIIAELDPLSSANNHNGGAMHFGTDGKLYIATGDNATPSHSQTLTNSHGKLLRINKDGSIPTDNPFYDVAGADQRIWSYGLRNPFTFDISNAGQILLNDVGQTSWEEINDATSGSENFGWPTTEGPTSNPNFTSPLYAYPWSLSGTDSTGCAITGGTFFEPTFSNYPQRYWGKYFFMDYCASWINVINPATGEERETFATNVTGAPISINLHPDGNLYYLSRDPGALTKITFSGEAIPIITDQSQDISVAETQPLHLFVTASGPGPFTYQWQKDGVDIELATDATYTISNAIPDNAGVYTVTVFNEAGDATSNPITVTVTEPNTPPTVTIVAPEPLTFRAGQSFVFKGEATDPEDGELDGLNMTWKVDLYHGDHVHDGIPTVGVDEISFTIPVGGGHDTETDIWYRITLSVTDLGGLTTTKYIELFPELIELTLNSNPQGLSVELDGQPRITPFIFQSVIGAQRTLSVASAPQRLSSAAYAFENWDHASGISVNVTPTINTTYTANFVEVPITEEVLSVAGDAYVQTTFWRESDATTAFGSTNPNELWVKTFTNQPDRRTYLHFDLDQLAGNTDDLLSATLKLHGRLVIDENGTYNPLTIELHEGLSSDWNENTITWANQPEIADELIASQTISDTDNADHYWDITSFINNAISNDISSITLVLVSATNHINWVQFNAKESGVNEPSIVFEYETIITSNNIDRTKEIISIFPNPSEDLVRIEGLLEQQNWKLINNMGNILLTGNEPTVDISTLNNGIYYLQIDHKSYKVIKK